MKARHIQPKTFSWVLALFGGALVLLVVVLVATRTAEQEYETRNASMGGKQYALLVADSPRKQELGLGKRSSLAQDQGMLFAYAQPQPQLCFWMKDMQFPIDIIWLDAAKRIIKIEPSLSPQSYPNTYCPTQPTQYVIEINAGQASALNLKTGQKLDL